MAAGGYDGRRELPPSRSGTIESRWTWIVFCPRPANHSTGTQSRTHVFKVE